MEDALDSRTSAIKRAHDGHTEDDPEPLGRPHAKRQRASSETSQQEYNTQSVSQNGIGHGASPSSPTRLQSIGTAPRVNWNAGAKAPIRTSLRRQNKHDVVKGNKVLLSDDAAIAERDQCEMTLMLLEKALRRISQTHPSDSRCKDLRRQIEIAEVDLQYCLNFPVTKKYERLFPERTAGENDQLSKPPLWAVVKQCMADMRLDDLRNGALDARLPEMGVELEPKPTEELPHGAIHNYGKVEKIGDGEPEDVAVEHVPVPLGDFPTKLAQCSHIHESTQSSVVAEASHDAQSESQIEESDGHEDDVVLNLAANERESGEIFETSPRAAQPATNGDQTINYEPQEYPVDIRGGNGSDDEDAMIGYSDASQPTKTMQIGSQAEASSKQSYHPPCLAELSEEDLRAQLRYFYINQDHRAIDFRTTLVKCLVCRGDGHTAADCPKLTCADCGAYNDHFRPFCPTTTRCLQCRERGHDQAQCKYKLKISATHVRCDLCFTLGHINEDCELMWRTSETLSDQSEVAARIADNSIRISCYECGNNSHLGNDCPTRKPGKPMGTTTWTLLPRGSLPQNTQGAPQLSIRSKGEMSIKGRAQQKRRISPDSESDYENNSFVRPKVPQPNKSGQIRIQAPRYNDSAGTTSIPVHVSRRGSSQYPHDNSHTQYGPHGGRSIPAQQTAPSYYTPTNTYYPPPLPQGPPPAGGNSYLGNYNVGGEYYRPMPSSGQNAWRQYQR